MIVENKVAKLYEFIGFRVRKDLAEIAITCSGYANDHKTISQDALALVGDHVIKMLLTSSEFMNDIKISKKRLNDKYQLLETNENLELIGERLNIKEFLLYVNTDLDGNKKLATSIEAIIGAIYLSEGIKKAEEFASKIGLIDKTSNNIFNIISSDIFEKRQTEMYEYGYQSLVFCVIDSVFSIAARYSSTKNVVKRFADHLNKSITDEYLVSEFITQFDTLDGHELLKRVFNNKQRTSTKNGILKAEAVIRFIKILYLRGIETKRDLLAYPNRDSLLEEIKTIEGQTKGTTFDYLLMLSGDKGVFKKDRHIENFFIKYFNVTDISYDNLKCEFEKQLEVVIKKYPDYNIRTLDSVIWNFMSNSK